MDSVDCVRIVHFSRTTLAHAGKSGRRVVAAFIATAFAQDDAASARTQWRQVADQIRPKLPKIAALMDGSEEDVLAYMTFPKEHRVRIHSTNPIERLNGESKRRTEVVDDIYVWLAYRLHVLEKAKPVSWKAVFDQFGTGATLRYFKPEFRTALAYALSVYPEAKVIEDEEGRGLVLHPSPDSRTAHRPVTVGKFQ